MTFTAPAYLLLLLLLVPLWLFHSTTRSELPARRRRLVLLVRLAIFLCLVLGLSGLRVPRPVDRLSTVFLIDDSESASDGHLQYARRFIQQSVKSASHRDEVQIALFGGQAYLDQVSQGSAQILPFSTAVPRDRTDIAQALGFARSLFPEGAARRIVLFSDGNENAGSAERSALAAGAEGTEIWTVAYPGGKGREVLVRSVTLPEQAGTDETFDLKILLESTVDTEAAINVFRNGSPVTRGTARLHRGENVFFVPQKLAAAGAYCYEVQVEPRLDTSRRNNAASAVTFLRGKPKVLYVYPAAGRPGPLPSLLAGAGIAVALCPSDALPRDLAQLHAYQSVIFGNVSALDLSTRQLEMVRSFVQDAGGGFIMVGGTNSFGIGGYYGTPVEQVLPVDMDIRKKKVLPKAAVMLLIDKSGSMGEGREGGPEKIALAREAAMATLDLLSPRDLFGVLAFDSAAKWVVQPGADRTKEEILGDIASLRAGGGTNLYPALSEALGELRRTKAAVKHILVLSDGRTEPGDFDALLRQVKDSSLTVSTVAIGRDADIPFLENMAKRGGGQAYYTDDATALPRIFVKDTFMASHSAILEEAFVPRLKEAHEVVRGLDMSDAPPLGGYCVTSAKPLSTTVLVSHKGDPVLALSRSGLGKSAAFTADEGGRWSARWFGGRQAGPLWLRLVRWSCPSFAEEGFSVTSAVGRDACDLAVEARDGSGAPRNFLGMRARIVTPSYGSFDAELRQTAPGRYGGSFPCGEPGNYLVTVHAEGAGSRSFAVSVPYSPEYKDLEADRGLLVRLAELSGGKHDPSPAQVFVHPRGKTITSSDLWEKLLLLALLLFPLDVALRRVFLSVPRLRRVLEKLTRFGAAAPPVGPSLTLAALKTRREEFRTARRGGDSPAPPGAPPPAPAGPSPGESRAAPARERKELGGETLSREALSSLERLKQAKSRARGKE